MHGHEYEKRGDFGKMAVSGNIRLHTPAARHLALIEISTV